jgi:DNA-binding SARP family transcriptional activator
VRTLALRLCGDVALTSPSDAPVEPPLGAKALALLAYLALEPGAHRREQVTALLWGDSPEEKARGSLRQALTRLRDVLGEALRIDRTVVELVGALECDVTEFTRLATSDRAAALAIEIPRFLEGFSIRGGHVFEEWADEKRATLFRQYARLMGEEAKGALAQRAWREAQQIAERWHDLDHLRDEPVSVIMEAQFLLGERDDALATYARHVARLDTEAKRVPGRAIVELATRLRHAEQIAPKAHTTESWYRQAPSFVSSLVGREREWVLLEQAWRSASTEGSRVMLIEGDPGVGKSRLADDFLRWVTSKGGVVLRGRGYDARVGAPFGALIEALHAALDAPELAGVDPEWLAEVSRMLPDLRRRFPGLADTSSGGAAPDGWRLYEAVAQLLLAIAEERPVAVMIDDLQWCDADSCGLLHFLVRRLGEAHVLWCATFTVGEIERDAPAARLVRALRAGRQSSSVLVGPLSEDDVWQLVRELARVDAPNGARRLAARIHEVTAGNPFYVIELLKTLFAQEMLTVDAATGAWIVPPAALANPAMPTLAPTVHEAIAGRIECLPDELHAVLISLAASGRGCRAVVLSHLHGISRLHAAMLGDALVTRHLAVEDEGTYRCAHPTIAEVVRARLSTSRRREVHRALALALEILLPTERQEGSEVGEIASHAEQAGDRPMAYRYALLAAEAARTRCAYDEALSWLDVAAGSASTSEASERVDLVTAQVLEEAGWREAPPVRAPLSLGIPRVGQKDLDLPLRA